MSRSRLIVAAGLCLAVLPAFAADADPTREIGTAAAHAGMAAGAEAPQMVRSHLQHVINCLEGPKGADFSDVVGNPCGSQGGGAIPDSASDHRKHLEDVAGMAKRALAEQNTDKAKQMATEIQSELTR